MTRTLLAVALLLAAPLAHAAGDTAKARLVDAKGDQVGTATFEQAGAGTKITIEVAGLKAGKHGFHLHAAGKCDPPEFQTAGGHYNPTHKQHGTENPAGPHAGDLPNLEVGADGTGKVTVVANGVKVADLVAGPGTAIVVHADPDDNKTDPAGNSGKRIACGVVKQ